MRSLLVQSFSSPCQQVMGIGRNRKLLMERLVFPASCIRAVCLHTNVSRVLITGALGQLGFGLARILRDQLGHHNVVMSDIHKASECVRDSGSFGPESPRNPTPDLAVQRPKSLYGICKIHAELMGEYYHTKFGLDFRCLRYPGVISEHKPGGGTTDYALKMFHDAVTNQVNICCLKLDTRLPMIYIDDLHHATAQYLQMPNNLLKKRTYNIGALDFSPEELALEIQKENPSFQVTYKPDYRQRIAETWPEKLDFSNAMNDWGYRPKYTLETACQKILRSLKSKLNDP
ncbi:L-threonine 3-dehydrogenase, mitochondrial-like isoform X2 [Biomphalaria glabrata]|uniref:L-threonine 3-dehydrogenase, mitochondrial-like isoform X2 n=1 Tax=Biomphalaria glabrata TaxID=6526 RepID=A0A9W3AF19_BIOGL|nr:L-threonine 3-dehydrogenase, mitochondrial-like isoform X2 [Biomphalaria glabrata]